MHLFLLVNVDWFFASHFLHVARRAKAAGFEVTLATEVGRERERLEAEGFRLVPLPARRGGIWPSGITGAVSVVARELLRSPGAVLHGFGLFGIVVGTLAADRARCARRVFTITGRGYTAVSDTPGARTVRALTRAFCRSYADRRYVRWIAENASDLEAWSIEEAALEGRAVIVGGAGVDPDVFTPRPMPPRPPLRAAFVGRMIWTKGVDLAVEAVRLARERGAEMELTLAGDPDPANPASLSPAELDRLRSTPGVRWLGRVANIPDLWAEHHVALLPSRGGEGVPRSLIEAAACGRPILTTRVAGCHELAERTGGWSVEAGSREEIASALIAACGEAHLAERGLRARQAVLEGYTEEANWASTSSFYDELQSAPEVPRPAWRLA